MYGLPEDTDLGFLAGRELIGVFIALHQVVLHFDGDVSVMIQCDFECDWDASPQAERKLPTSAVCLLRLLGLKTNECVHLGNGDLKILFDRGLGLTLFDSDPNYECYEITAPDRQIVV